MQYDIIISIFRNRKKHLHVP